MATAAGVVPLAAAPDLNTLMPVALGQSAVGSLPVWNGAAWSWIAPGSDTQVLTSDNTQTLGVKWAAVPGSPTAIVDGSVDKRDLRTGASWRPAGALGETCERFQASGTITPTSQQLLLTGGLTLRRGVTISGIGTVNTQPAAGGVGGQVNLWFCLVDQSRNVLAKTVDDGSNAWGPLAVKTLALTAPYTPVADVPVYVGFLINASGQMPTLHSLNSVSQVAGLVPYTCASADSGLTGPSSLGATTAALTALAQAQVFMWVY